MDKTGQLGESLWAASYLLLLVIFAGGIAGGHTIFFGGEIDYRKSEAELLNYKVQDCIYEQSINGEWEVGFEVCNLDMNNIKKNIIIEVLRNGEEEWRVGSVSDFEECYFEGAKRNSNFKQCSIQKIFVLGEEIEIKTGSGQFIHREGLDE